MIEDQILHQKRVIQILSGILIFLQSFLYASTYVQAALFGQLEFPAFLISDTIAGDPGRAIATFFFPILSMLIFIIAGSRISRMSRIFVDNYDAGVKAWRINGRIFTTLQVSVIVTVVGIVGVAAVPVTVQPLLHTIIAGIMVVAGSLASVCFTILDYRLGIQRPKWIEIVRNILSFLGVAGAITFGALLETQKLAASIFEIIDTCLFTIYLTTFSTAAEFPLRVTYGPNRPPPRPSNPPI